MQKFLGAIIVAATVASAVTLMSETRVAAATPAPPASVAGSQIPRHCDRGWPYEATCRPTATATVRRIALDRF